MKMNLKRTLQASHFLTTCQEKLRDAGTETDRRKGQQLVREVAWLIDGPEFDKLPEAAQEGLLQQYATVMFAVTGAMMP